VDAQVLTVELRFATLPSVLRAIAIHHWFVVFDPERPAERWEVWQTASAGGKSWGHVHRNLMHPDRPVGGGPTCLVCTWTGDDAARIRAVLQRPEDYPHYDRYRYWPGPNSNTYAAWVLHEAGITHRFDLRAHGCRYLPRHTPPKQHGE
jgi:hypothetical protein